LGYIEDPWDIKGGGTDLQCEPRGDMEEESPDGSSYDIEADSGGGI
jgi:hypothetical protein